MSGVAYAKPTENLAEFNNIVFTDANATTLSLATAKSLFLGRTGTPNSTATLTSFTGGDLLIQGATFGLGKGAKITNVALGTEALLNNSTGDKNVACNYYALRGNTTGNSNIAIGHRCLQTSNANYNVAIGDSSLINNTSGNSNVAVGGIYALTANQSGSSNVAVGDSSLFANTSGNNNVAIGFEAFKTGATFTNSTALGASTVITGNSATAIGKGASAGANQIVLGTATETVNCVGTASSISLTTARNLSINGMVFGTGNVGVGSGNIFIGQTSGTNGNGNTNTVVGHNAFTSAINTTSVGNTFIGSNAGKDITATVTTCTIVGQGSYTNTAAAYNGASCLGYDCQIGGANSTAIGTGAATGGANQIMLGTSTEFVECAGTDATNGSLKLKGGLILQTSYGSAPSSTMLGYKLSTTTLLATVTGGTGAVALNVLSTTIPTIGIYLCEASIIYSTSVASFYVFCSISTTSATLNSNNQTNVFTSAAVQTNQVVRTTAVITTSSANTVLYAVGQSGAASQTIASGFLQFTRIA